MFAILTGGCSTPRERPRFEHSTDAEAKPWTHERFANDLETFRFVVMADRTGGQRVGVFADAVQRVNALQPDFVLSVGDLIYGYTDDEKALEAMWSEFLPIAQRFEMPFFMVPGNHDSNSPAMEAFYRKLFGRNYYAFTYRNVLFLCLDSQDPTGPGMTNAQIDWAVDTIRRHRDVRWTFVVVHQPVWLHAKSTDEGFGRIEQALSDRPYSVFAGHTHHYMHTKRKGRDYFVLATTGGGSGLRGPEFGEFDHFMWVTVGPDGPRYANMSPEGVLSPDVHTPAHRRLLGSLGVGYDDPGDFASGTDLRVNLSNPFEEPLDAKLTWAPEAAGNWRIDPVSAHVVLPPGEEWATSFNLRYSGARRYPTSTLPELAGSFRVGDFSCEVEINKMFPVDPVLTALRPTIVAPKVEEAPVIDGVLDDTAWIRDPDVTEFMTPDLQIPHARTEAWMVYDSEALYVAARCHEPGLHDWRCVVTNRDGRVWEDNSFQVFLDADDDVAKYPNYAVNPNGVLYDALQWDHNALNGNGSAASSREATSWTTELRIPWSDLGLQAPPLERPLAFLLAHHRPNAQETQQYPPLNGWNHRRSAFGFLRLSPPGDR